MEREHRSDRFTAIEDQYSGYEVYDHNGEKIGKVDDLFVDENDQPEYLGVKMGFLGTRSTLIPWELARVDEEGHRIEVSVDKDTAKEGPSFDDDEDITPEYENEVRSHYGLGAMQGAADRGTYGEYYHERDQEFTSSAAAAGVAGGERPEAEARGAEARGEGPLAGKRGLDREREGREREVLEREGIVGEGLGATTRGTDEDELRVQRTEEELRADTREREAGAVRVRKRVRTDREQISVPTKHEEVSVERVPVEEDRREAQGGEKVSERGIIEEAGEIRVHNRGRDRGREAPGGQRGDPHT